jgi:hypothetical protein
LRTKRRTATGAKKQTPASEVTAILESYAERAVFRGFSAHPGRGGKASFRMVWHYDRPFELLLDSANKTLTFPAILPGIPARSPMYRELQAFLKSRQSAEVPEHRRVNPSKARLTLTNQKSTASITVMVKDGDFEYATRKIIQMVHEIFLIFLVDGPYFEYTVEHLGLDADQF